jgi:hypothetical protein
LNYINLLNDFWLIRRSNNLSSTQADLYYCLLQECNQRRWPKSFQVTNKLLCAQILLSEKSLIEARKRLKQTGLIDFEAGITKKKPPTYYILNNCNKVSNEVSNEGNKPAAIKGVINGTYINKLNNTKTNLFDSYSPLEKRQEEFKLAVFGFDYENVELQKFYEYWAEPDQLRTKMRCETEKTWDTKSRLNRWMEGNKRRANLNNSNEKYIAEDIERRKKLEQRTKELSVS